MLGVYILAISVFACVVVGSLVVTRGLHDKRTVIYGLLTLSLLTLCVMNSLAIMLEENQIIYVRGVMASTTVSMYLIYVLIMELKERRGRKPYYKTKLFYATIAMFFVDFTDLLFTGVIPGEPPKPIPNIGIIFFFGLYIATLGMGIKQLRKDMDNASNKKERRRYSLLIAGIIPIVFLAPLTSFVMPNYLGINQFVVATPLYVLIFVSLVGYAIVRHQLFDVKLAAVRSMAYLLALGTLAIVYYIAAYLVSTLFIAGQTSSAVSLSPINVLLALLLVLMFQPIKRFFDKVTDDIFYRENYKSEDFFASLSLLLSSTTDLRGLLERTSKQMADTFKVEQALFFLYYTNKGERHMSAGTHGHAHFPLHDARMLDRYVSQSTHPIILTDLIANEYTDIRRMLISHRVALVMPLKHRDAIVGYVMLGDRLSSTYTKRDLNVLQAVSNELVIAVQNALSLHEVKELNATLQQRIDVATKELRSSNNQLKHLDEIKDEFISMASHQLRTPLTSVKGYLSMLLDGDAGKVTPQQQKLLTEAFHSSERMVHLIADFLNLSRLQTGKFIIEKEPIDIKELIRQEAENLELIAKTRKIKFRLNVTDKDLPVTADASKIQQIVMNFVDNAIYYSQPNSTIILNLEKVKNDVAFTVVDTGIGVPEDEKPKLFTKFYRANNARKQRPDGTGVGLFMARRAIEAHDGKIVFSSKEGRGSTFGFRIPLDREGQE